MADHAELEPFLQSLGRFLDEVVSPLESRFLLEGFAAVAGELERARDEARARGLFAPQLPVEDGGLGLSLVEVGEVSRILGRSPIGHFALHMQAPDVSNMELLHRFASASQREQFYRPLAAGRIRSCFSMTEPDHAGSNPVIMSTTATKVDGGWRIDGRKWFTSSADGAHFAVVMAVTDADARPHERATFFIVPTDTPGFRIVQNLPVMGEAHAVGQAGWASHAEVVYEGVVVPDELRLGPVGGGFQMAQERLGPGRIHHAMRWIGITERALELMVARAASRELAPGVRLGHKDTIQGWIGRSWAELEAARLFVRECARRVEAEGGRSARLHVSGIKLVVADLMQRVLDRAIQVHGALGMTDLTPLAFWFRHERAARIYDGPDEVHEQLVARELLGAAGMPRPGKG